MWLLGCSGSMALLGYWFVLCGYGMVANQPESKESTLKSGYANSGLLNWLVSILHFFFFFFQSKGILCSILALVNDTNK